MRSRGRTPAPVVAGLVSFLLAGAAAVPAGGTAGAAAASVASTAPAAEAFPAEEPGPGGADAERPAAIHRFYISGGWSREFLNVEFDDRATARDRNIAWDAWGSGITAAIGYSFGPRFRGEMALTGGWREARPDVKTAASGMARFTGIIPLATGGRWEPHLIAGFTGAFLFFETEDSPELSYLMTGGDFGAGVRVSLNRRWGLQIDFIHSVLDLEQEGIEEEDGQVDLRNVGRRGRLETIRVGFTYDL